MGATQGKDERRKMWSWSRRELPFLLSFPFPLSRDNTEAQDEEHEDPQGAGLPQFSKLGQGVRGEMPPDLPEMTSVPRITVLNTWKDRRCSDS